MADPRRRFARNRVAMAATVMLGAFYLAALLAPFLAPYPPDELDRARFLQPPQPLRWVDATGRFHARPFVYAMRPDADGDGFREDRSRPLPLRFGVTGTADGATARPPRRHLFGVDAPERVHLLGTDPLGRDELARLLYGARVSLTVGLVGIALSFTLGLLAGGIAGYAGGWVDAVVMRGCELLQSVPVLYLLIALRSVFPRDLPSDRVYLGIVALLALVGWATLARVVRGMVLSIRRADYVAAAEALGMSRARVLVRHILPNTLSFVVVAATLAVPGYILGEVVLSFLGVGVQEPLASWGNMLQQARSPSVLASCPWLLSAPGTAIFLTVMAFNLLGDGLRDALDPRDAGGARS
jgi:peptide/nickel transport system permease protein